MVALSRLCSEGLQCMARGRREGRRVQVCLHPLLSETQCAFCSSLLCLPCTGPLGPRRLVGKFPETFVIRPSACHPGAGRSPLHSPWHSGQTPPAPRSLKNGLLQPQSKRAWVCPLRMTLSTSLPLPLAFCPVPSPRHVSNRSFRLPRGTSVPFERTHHMAHLSGAESLHRHGSLLRTVCHPLLTEQFPPHFSHLFDPRDSPLRGGKLDTVSISGMKKQRLGGIKRLV